ncbi:MAG: peptidylprolyl isomerase [Methylococcales bacterium]|nr:peptidylprolyl isomerase [Methylococcales bacterium]MDD5755201.1 peptidylprolyl isomerase [Methylococcales bacterium]
MNKKKNQQIALLCSALLFPIFAPAEVLDNIVAVVEDDVILENELQKEVSMIEQRIAASKSPMPPLSILRRQVLERMIVDKLQRQLAEKAGINVSDEMLNSSAADIAKRNNMSPEEFRHELEKQGMSYAAFLENMKNEIVVNELRGREIGGRIKVTDREVEHYLETQQGKVGEDLVQYHLGHILIALPEGASAAAIQKAQTKADEIVKKLRAGQDFTQTAMSESSDSNALKGGDLGWRTLKDMPTLFVSEVGKLRQGDISAPLRSPSGFHIIKMLELKGLADGHTVVKTKVRHILIKTNELVDDAEASKRAWALKERITNGDDFATLARANSDDKGSAIKGGSLDWVESGALVKPFEEAMSKLKINEISDPVQTQFGWHIIQVLDRENRDNSAEFKKNQVRDAIRKRKIEEETELWLRKLRDEAFVEIKENRL